MKLSERNPLIDDNLVETLDNCISSIECLRRFTETGEPDPGDTNDLARRGGMLAFDSIIQGLEFTRNTLEKEKYTSQKLAKKIALEKERTSKMLAKKPRDVSVSAIGSSATRKRKEPAKGPEKKTAKAGTSRSTTKRAAKTE